MSDWLTHSLVGWIAGKVTALEVSLLVLGSVLPDINKMYLIFQWGWNLHLETFFLPLHTPVGAMLLACGVALFFKDFRKTIVSLGVGIGLHFALDILLVEVGGGEHLLFPLSWDGWQLNVIPASDYDVGITLYVLGASVLVYIVYSLYGKKKARSSD
jgi:LexA-binding, inner membrane-associated putative hydrolase